MSANDTHKFDPLNRRNLGVSVAEALLKQPVHQMDNIAPFVGAGIYAIYYTGPLPFYGPIALRNREGLFSAPIYVGKAVPAGSRRGGGDHSDYQGNALWSRLYEHADSIKQVSSLSVNDFHCRYLVVDDIWIPLAESLLIARFSPLWNRLIDGFGNHDPGKGRYEGLRPRWDTLHPGRAWAFKCRERPETAEQIQAEIVAYLATAPAGFIDTVPENGNTSK